MVSPAVQGQVRHPWIVPEFLRSTKLWNDQCTWLRLHESVLATDHVILNHDQVTWTTPELVPPLLTTTPHQREDVSALDRFNVHRCPTWRVFSGTELELVTMQATIRYHHSATSASILARKLRLYMGLGSNPGEDIDVCKCIVPLRHLGTLNSSRTASHLVMWVEGEERWEASDPPLKYSPSKLGWNPAKSYCHLYGAQSYGQRWVYI
ncbi:uncharacterized protein TNCV_185821 [Trichonephila clavipes]|nr:uncharacterized protein TNCV_185821 [Trichonephila clavipes]